ncbi:MAG: hypothetical protein K0Q65_2096 [Clostridia bacterium]|jgi:hypothetical protein|nr:hypothetical protein [Clostridia bacterium]
MGMFETVKFVPGIAGELSEVASDAIEHFRAKGFEIKDEHTITGGYNISLSKGNLFKSVLGMKTALNIEIDPSANGTKIKAGVGIFGQQAVPSIITAFIAWPVLIAQIWGMVQQSKLDDESVRVIEESLHRHAANMTNKFNTYEASGETVFCTECGYKLEPLMKFCPACGSKR